MAITLPRLLVGLGNPGSQYQATRHNIGFMLIDRLLQRMAPGTQPEHVAQSHLWTANAKGRAIWLQKPLTFMNLSGEAVRPILAREQLAPEDLLIIYDDADLPLGRLRFRAKGSSGGHNGIESIMQHLATGNFQRLRLGIGRETAQRGALKDHVLAPFEADETALLDQVIDEAAEAAMLCVHRGLTAAMNQYNGLDLAEPEQQPTDNEQRGESEV